MDDNEWANIAEEFKARTRPHAGFFSFEGDKATAEFGVLCEFSEAFERLYGHRLQRLEHRGPNYDPPDCEALGFQNSRIGIEVTELVDERSAKAARARTPFDDKDWRVDLIPSVQSLLSSKDQAALKGGPFDEYYLVIHTDERWLEIDRIEAELKTHFFEPTKLITRAFLLISYDPFLRACPLFELRLGEDQMHFGDGEPNL